MNLAVDVNEDCPIEHADAREFIKRSLERVGIDTKDWPSLDAEKPWFGLLLTIECQWQSRQGDYVFQSQMYFRLSFVDAVDGEFIRFGHDGPFRVGQGGLGIPDFRNVEYFNELERRAADELLEHVERILDRIARRFINYHYLP